MRQQWIHGMHTSKTVRPDPQTCSTKTANYDYHVVRSICTRLYCETHGINNCAEGRCVNSKAANCRRIKIYRNKQYFRNISSEIDDGIAEYNDYC